LAEPLHRELSFYKVVIMHGNYHVRETCRLCGYPHLQHVVDMPPTVSGNRLKKRADEPDPELVPIDLYQCERCGHVQVIHIPPPDTLYGSEYPFMPGNNPTLLEHFSNTVNYFVSNFTGNVNFALEIGSNDGVFLEKMRAATGCQTLGVDPSSLPVEFARKRGIETIVDYFSKDLARRIVDQYGNPDLIIANNVFAHIDDLRGVIQGIDTLLLEGGYFLFEISYLKDVVDKYLVGTVIHEHLSIHSLTSLVPCLREHNLDLKSAQYIDHVQGGAIVGICQKTKFAGESIVPEEVNSLMQAEARSGITNVVGMKRFNVSLKSKISSLKSQIHSLAREKRIIGYGAAVSAPIIIDLLDIRNEIKCVIDDNPFKKGKYLPIGNIPIIGIEDYTHDVHSTVIVILGWAQTDRILKNLSGMFAGALAVTIYPEFEIKEI
jgi:SAM-dependent methyltransferase